MHGIESSPSALVTCSRSWAPPVSASHASRPRSSARSATHSSSRSVPALRRGHHVLAGRRGRQAAFRSHARAGRRGNDRGGGRRPGGGHLERGDRLGVSQAGRAGRDPCAPRLRLRRRALGRGDVPRPRRARRRPLAGRADPPPLHGTSGLLDRRAGWAGGKVNATNVLLEPLGPDETKRLIESLAHLDEEVGDRIREAAEGNPLFVEEMVAIVGESPDGDVTFPPDDP
jgi:hypothetical protein